ncbi:MAG: CbiX/SirB N-terminal domain-containing protein [Peptococcaceae bacterium]|nr:CbiX/SirB N-terminal domain-containing protein [Peptococcaceae bacterium]
MENKGAQVCGVIILGHGSRYPEGRRVIEETVARYQKKHPQFLVRPAFVEMAQPQLEEAVAALVSEGVGQIVVVPLFLSFGHHIAEDLPTRMNVLQEAHHSVKFITTAPIGADPLLCDIVQARIESSAPECLQ